MTDDFKMDAWRAVVTAVCVVLPVGAVYLVALLRGLTSDLAQRAQLNVERDKQRNEVQENVRRLVNGKGVSHDSESKFFIAVLWRYWLAHSATLVLLAFVFFVALRRWNRP